MQPNTRIAVNTLAIYTRLLITIFVSLFSTRYVLLALGATDFGIYNLVAGVVALFAFISNTMAGTTQRYISYNMGVGDVSQVARVFYCSYIMHLMIAVVVFILIEIGGVYFISNVLSIPDGRYDDALFVLHCVSAGLMCTIMTVPYEAVLMAHENIVYVSVVVVLHSVIKLVGAIGLLYIGGDRLRLYAVIMAIIPLITLALQYVFCKKRYSEVNFEWQRITDFSLFKDMCRYAGWVLIGVMCATFRTQGAAILLNVFYGVIANAANGVAMQINGVMQQFSTSITTSIRPQLIKSAGEKNMDRMLSLTYAACKYPFLLLGLLAIPLIIAMPYVLELWLKEVPENTVVFCRLLLVNLMCIQATKGITAAIEATGKVKTLHMTVGLFHIVSLPIAYILFRLGAPAQTIFLCIIGESIASSVFRVILAKYLVDFSILKYLFSVLCRALFVFVIEGFIGLLLWSALPHNFIGLIIMCLGAAISFIIGTITCGLTKRERQQVYNWVNRVYKKII